MKKLIPLLLLATSLQAGWFSDLWTKMFGGPTLPKFTMTCSTPITAGNSGTCTINLSKRAPKGGMAFNITTSNAIMTTPARVAVPSGATSTTFTFKTVAPATARKKV